VFFDDEGNLLDEKAKDPKELSMRKKISDSHNKFEDLVQLAKNYEIAIDFLCSSLSNLMEPLQNIVPAATVSKQDEFEIFLGGKIPQEVQYIHQLILCPKDDAKELQRARRQRYQDHGSVENASS
jgi:hypothetical protein